MDTSILKIDSFHPELELLQEAAEVIRRGGIVAGPTDTVYGLFAEANNAAAVTRIYQIKGRDFRRPLILLIADKDAATQLCAEIPDLAREAMARFWPGGLTVILEKSSRVPDYLTSGGKTIGLRWPAHGVTEELIRAADTPLASTSANRSTQSAARSAQEIMNVLAGEIELIIDAGPAPLGLESSVVDFTPAASGLPPRLLREGCLERKTLEAALGALG